MRPGGYRVYFDEFDSLWCCTGTGQPTALAGQHFMVYAPDLQQAQACFQTMLDALQPGKPPLILPQTCWSAAPKPLQPDGPVRPGVQGIWN